MTAAGENRSEKLPALAGEAAHLPLLNGEVIVGVRFYPDPRKEERKLQVKAGCLPHDIVMGEIVTALLKHLNKRLCRKKTIHDRRVRPVGIRIIPVEKGVPLLHCR